MAHLTQPERYNIEDTNIALLGSDLEKRVREHAGDKEAIWDAAGKAPGTEIWRVEKFKLVPWPAERMGVFYAGDSYIVLHTYKKTPESEELSYDIHFWLGEETSQDEAGTAAYKTVELDDHLHGSPVQYREVQSFESPRFLSYFPRFVTLDGGVSTGFHHVSAPPPLELHRLYHIKSVNAPDEFIVKGYHSGASPVVPKNQTWHHQCVLNVIILIRASVMASPPAPSLYYFKYIVQVVGGIPCTVLYAR